MQSRPSPTDARGLARFGAVAAAAIVAHLPALRAGFVLDDDALLVSNPFVRTLGGLRVLVTSELFAASAQPQNVPYYRPLTGALYWASWQLFGGSAPGQHALNLALHAAVAVALFVALERFAIAQPVALFAAILFAVHPGTADTVAYVGGRQDLAGWLVVLAALAFVAKPRAPTAVAVATFVATLAAASFREFFACAALLLLAAARHRRAAAVGGGAALAAIFALRRAVHVQAFAPSDAGPLAYFDGAAGVALRLAKDVVAPTDLAVYVSVPQLGLAALLVAAACVAAALAIDRATRDDERARALGWCAVAAGAATAAMHGAVSVKYGSISDRYAYEAIIVAALAGAAVAASLRSRAAEAIGPRLAPLVRALPAVIALALVPLTWSRAAAYRDQTALQTAMIEERPDDPESRLAEGFRLFAKGDLEGAHPHCAAYAAARPSSDRANLCVGTWLVVHGRARDAVPLLRPYALARPGDARARRALLASMFASGDAAGIAALLDEWEPAFPGAPDLVEAREELARRLAPPTPK